jgi:hypothetical protein
MNNKKINFDLNKNINDYETNNNNERKKNRDYTWKRINRNPNQESTENNLNLNNQNEKSLKNTKSVKAINLNSMKLFPSEYNKIEKEEEIKKIEGEISKLNNILNKLNNDLIKMPEFPKKKIEIDQRREIEIEIENYNTKINEQKKN